jgi:hypothetical protein
MELLRLMGLLRAADVTLLLLQLCLVLSIAAVGAEGGEEEAEEADAPGTSSGEDGAAGDGGEPEGAEDDTPVNHFETVNVFDGLDSRHLGAVVVGLLGIGAYMAMQWKKAKAQEALARSMAGNLGLAESDEEEDGIEIDKKTGQLKAEGSEVITPTSQSGQGPDTAVDLSGCDPEVIEAWEQFQAAARTQNFAANIPIMEKAVAAFEAHLPAAHQASMQTYIHLARNYQQVGMWDKCDKLCARACEKLDTASAGGPVKQTLITLCCAEGMACFRTKKDRKQHGENCYRRALKVVREMSHPSWRPVELNTIHEFARELLGAAKQKEAVKEMHSAMEMLDNLAEEQLDEDGEVVAAAHPMAMGANGAINRSAILRTMSQAAASMGSMEAAEGGLREAIKLASTINADQATMQVECAKRELAFLITTRLPARVAEAEPLLRNVLEMLQARKAPMTLWLEIATDLGDVLGKQGKYPQVRGRVSLPACLPAWLYLAVIVSLSR